MDFITTMALIHALRSFATYDIFGTNGSEKFYGLLVLRSIDVQQQPMH
jgi:hypothetical protein